jgi:cellulose synthase/poly-beta-1,6-N-acetylglucosamine synthase-like glycosyltransferase
MIQNNLTVIIPVKNEEKNISLLVERIDKSLKDQNIAYSMIFVNDHSTDQTAEVLNNLKNIYPLEVYTKVGKPGKAYSILEGAKYAKTDFVAMIDADLQYPPEVLPQMLNMSGEFGVVIGSRKQYQAGFIRRFISHNFSFIFGSLLHGFNQDVQSGLKLIKREILNFIDKKDVSPWTIDLALLNTARELGYKIGEVDIVFEERKYEKSKVSLIKSSFEIGTGAIKQKIYKKKTFQFSGTGFNNLVGAGIIHNKEKLITHTSLEPFQTALKTFTSKQIFLLCLILSVLVVGFFWNAFNTAVFLVGFLSTVYFIDVLFNLALVFKSLHFPPEFKVASKDLTSLDEKNLPIYTILCPLYKEAHILPHFLDSIEKLDYPKDKLDVILLLEEDDTETIDSASDLNIPFYVRTLIVPDSQPKTKPKACNFGLAHARGEYLVIYDAEDRPEPLQLKKAYIAFQKVPASTVCLQAKLNYFNPSQNLLTRFFTAEYSLWFDVVLPGLQSIDSTIPLGGTSNHFKTQTLLNLKGWDPFNVTEDCDLGVRLFKEGFKTAIIDSITLEEANSSPKNWLRQRSRWIKGYMQTYLVHMRNPLSFIKEHGIHAFVFQLVIGARISFMLINPFLWLVTFSYFAFFDLVGPQIEAFFPSLIFYVAVISLVFGNFMYIYNYMIGLAKREHFGLIKYIFLTPLYWLLASVAASIALYQLLVKPHYWEKTEHGLHIRHENKVGFSLSRLILKPIYQPLRYITSLFF